MAQGAVEADGLGGRQLHNQMHKEGGTLSRELLVRQSGREEGRGHLGDTSKVGWLLVYQTLPK